MSDPAREAVLAYLRRRAVVYCDANDVMSRARLLLMGYDGEQLVEDRGRSHPVVLDSSLCATLVRMSETDADMWDACRIAVERLIRRAQPLPAPLAEWNLAVLDGKRKRPTKRGGAEADRKLKNLARDVRIHGAVWAAMQHGLPAYDNTGATTRTACHVVAECLVALDKAGDPAGEDLGYEAVRAIYVARERGAV